MLFSLERGYDRQRMALLNVVQIVDRPKYDAIHGMALEFDNENVEAPVLKKFLLPGENSYEIVGALYDKNREGYIEVASLKSMVIGHTPMTVTAEPVETTKESETVVTT